MLKGQREEKRPHQTRAIIGNGAVSETQASWGEQDNSAKHGGTAAGVFWWDRFFVMETRSHIHVRETGILIQRKKEAAGSNVGGVCP